MDRTELLQMDKLELVGIIAKLEAQLPSRQGLEAQCQQQEIQVQHAFDQLKLDHRRLRQLQDRLGVGGTLDRYHWTSGEMNLLLQYVIHQYLPATDDSGDPVDDQHLHDFGWTLINLLDGELDHGVYHRDQVMGEVAEELGWDGEVDLSWWLRHGAGHPDAGTFYRAVKDRLVSALDFNLQELQRQLGYMEERHGQ